ncbi:hypothetical protein B566_EDAN006263 [Ephemera danica]|nr:hypothetical protein B566_EDAN006263 [Ephemera danica]
MCFFIRTDLIPFHVFRTGFAIDCYQCQSTDHDHPYRCPEFFADADPDGFHLEARPCDIVHGAQYCIKQTGRFEGGGIRCYQCDSATDVGCSDALIHEGFTPIARNCDHVFEARFCIKTNGLYGGDAFAPLLLWHAASNLRFCSSLDLGNYCNYVRQPGDDLEYRSCVYTCSSDACNPAPRSAAFSPACWLLIVVTLVAAKLVH